MKTQSGFLAPADALHLLDLARSKVPPPPEITQLKAEIAGQQRILELRASMNVPVTEADIHAIVQMKLRLDGLYGQWAQGNL